MNRDKKCPNCARTYRGEGFQGVCTEYCAFKQNNPNVFKQLKHITSSKYIKKPIPTTEDSEKKRIAKINKRWVEREEPLHSAPQHENGAKLARKAVFDDAPGSWIKRFIVMRG